MRQSVPGSTIRRRSRALAELSRLKTLAQHERHIGRTMSVLFEQGERNFMRVAVASQDDLAGALRDVTITGATEGMALGRLVPASHHPSTVPLL
jgi:threonylcarbamoyladenosine tRNA methylthiotransferase MtaB